jgi:hypothetical protein
MEASRKANQVRLVAGKAYWDVAQATAPVRMAENLKLRADAKPSAAEFALGSATTTEAKEQAEFAKAQAAAEIADLQTRLDAAKAEPQPKLDVLTTVREASAAAETAQAATADALRQVARQSEPASVLISRKTQRLYIRQAFEPVLESPVTILDAGRPSGPLFSRPWIGQTATPISVGTSSHWREHPAGSSHKAACA